MTIAWQTRSRWLWRRCLVMQTDALTHQGDVCSTSPPSSQRRSGRGGCGLIRQAIDVYDRKQNVASARSPSRLAAGGR